MSSLQIYTPDRKSNGRLVFHPALKRASQDLTAVLTVTSGRVRLEVRNSPLGSPFVWNAIPAVDLLAGESKEVRVTFKPSSDGLLLGEVPINVQDLIPGAGGGLPSKILLAGNVPGVGPGTLDIVRIVPDPPGPDLQGELVVVANVSLDDLDLTGCSFGDHTYRLHAVTGARIDEKERTLLPAKEDLQTFRMGPTLRPVATSGDLLTIFTGAGQGPLGPLAVALNRQVPVWNNTGDTAWIKNENGQYIVVHSYFTSMSKGPIPPDADVKPANTRNAFRSEQRVLNGKVPWLDTGIAIEEGDLCMFFATGEISLGGLAGSSTPVGRPTNATVGWPMPDAPQYALIGKFGADGDPFYIGGGMSRIAGALDLLEAPPTLFLGINDDVTGDNGGVGYDCRILINSAA